MELRRCTYANFASHVLTVDYAPNQEATSVLHGLVCDLLTSFRLLSAICLEFIAN